MSENFNLATKFSIFLVVGLGVLGLILGSILSSEIKKSAIDHAKLTTGEVISLQIKQNLNKESIFSTATGFRMQRIPAEIEKIKFNQEELNRLLGNVGTEEISRINVWDANATIIYSDSPEIIGLSFPENKFYKEALSGKNFSVAVSEESDVISRYKGRADLPGALEVYVPIFSSEDNTVIGVIETYHPIGALKQDILRNQTFIWFVIFSVLAILLIFLLFFFKITVTNPLQKLKKSASVIGKGDFKNLIEVKSNDEIGGLAQEFNSMTKNLRNVVAKLGRKEELDRLKSEYVTIMSHKFLTPLTNIKWAINNLEDKNLPDDKREMSIKNIGNNAEKLVQLTSSLLDTTEMEDGLFGYKFEKVNLVSIIEKGIRGHNEKIKNKNISISFNKSDTEEVYVNGDKNKLGVVIENLLDNSTKYTPKDGRVEIELKKDKENARVSIKDTGIGISKEAIPYIFSKFFRDERAKTIHTEGTGLGLFIVKNIIERHKGKVGFTTHENRGVTFFFTLPLA